MSKSIGTNIPKTSLERRSIVASGSKYQRVLSPRDIMKGGYSGEDPPLPIPNREVKLTCADGTATPSGRVGCRQL